MYLLRLISAACLLAIATCFHATAAVQQGAAADLDSLLTRMARAIRHTRAVPQEKVYLHFDNTGYYMGEKIRFKAYVVRADDRTPTPMSRVLHVELLNPGGDIVQRRKLKVDGQGQAHGDFALDSIYATGFYEVRAFTRYMANWGTYSQPFSDVRYDNSFLLEASYDFRHVPALKGWHVGAAFALDRGSHIGDNTGFQLTLSRSGLLLR